MLTERLGWAGEDVGGLKLDGRSQAASPFKLEIPKSEYRVRVGSEPLPAQKGKQPKTLNGLIEKHAAAKGLDPALVHAVVKAESAYRPDAVSPKGAVGLMQVMPATGQRFGVANLESPEANLRAGTTYLRYLLDRFDNVPLALAAYNAGEGAVARHGNQIPPYAETRGYVQDVMASYRKAVMPESVSVVYMDGVRLNDGQLSAYRLNTSARR